MTGDHSSIDIWEVSYNGGMEVVRSLFSILWFILSCLLTGFILWRKLRRERVDNEDKIFDLIVFAALGSLVAGRVAFILFHLQVFGGDVSRWLSLSQFPGSIGVISLLTGIVLFWRLLGDGWKDSIEQVDYISIALSFFLFLIALGDVISQVIQVLQSAFFQSAGVVPVLDMKTPIVSVLFLIAYGCLYLFLSTVEKNYRTFLWYRAKRRSAETGFVIACFLIGYGLVGFLLSWFAPMSMVIFGFGLDPVFKLLVMLSGFVVLYVRSGRSLIQN